MNRGQFYQHLLSNNKKHVIFDFDETLCTIKIDWNGWIKELSKILRTYDSSFVPSRKDFGVVQNKFIRKFGDKVRDEVWRFSKEYELKYTTGYIEHKNWLGVIKGMPQITMMFLWSSNSQLTVEQILKKVGIFELFQKVVAREDVTFLKPDPEGFKLINNQSFSKKEYLMVGDSSADEGAASNAGIDFMHVSILS